MKKTDVYVVVDTPKKAKKLKELLNMFGESHFSDIHKVKFNDCVGNVVHFWQNKYFAYCNSWAVKNKTEVSIKELRNILAREYLKEGDFVVIKSIYNDDWVMEVDTVEDYKAYHKLAINKSSGFKVNKGFLELNFIRYATEEEKDLLEPKKELEIGKWYKHWSGTIAFLTKENVFGYGISAYTKDGVKDGNYHWVGYEWFLSDSDGKWIEANIQEVEQALIEEAKIIGHAYTEYDYNPEENELCGINDGRLESLFCDGNWEQPISKLADSDASIVELLHDTLLDNHGYSLESKLLTDARLLANKIKSNIK